MEYAEGDRCSFESSQYEGRNPMQPRLPHGFDWERPTQISSSGSFFNYRPYLILKRLCYSISYRTAQNQIRPHLIITTRYLTFWHPSSPVMFSLPTHLVQLSARDLKFRICRIQLTPQTDSDQLFSSMYRRVERSSHNALRSSQSLPVFKRVLKQINWLIPLPWRLQLPTEPRILVSHTVFVFISF